VNERIELLQRAFKQAHNLNAEHVQSIPVVEAFKDQMVWDGVIEIFAVANHPVARVGYGWAYEENGEKRYATVLGVPPINSLDALRTFVASLGRKNGSQKR